ncbi:MAG: hypothetical protein ACJAUD_001342 [Crocinitomicaceae bacterium]|jgi:hypothetical protein
MTHKLAHTFSESVLQNEANENRFFRMMTSAFRTAPSVFILGAQKAGTTSLYKFLVENNCVAPSSKKEIYFFNNQHNFEKGLNWYNSHFRLFSLKPTCDATANYFESANAAKRLHKHFPEAKLIVLLRNPVDRAFSHYQMAVKFGFEKLSFEDALQCEDERLEYRYELDNKHNYMRQRLGYRTKGKYSEQLKKWLEFFPMNQIHVVQSEQLFWNPEIECQKVLEFLGVPSQIRTVLTQANAGTKKKISNALRTELNDFYAPYNRELYVLLNEDFNWK